MPIPHDIWPHALTANNSDPPYLASASSYNVGYEPWRAFDGNWSTNWWNSSTLPAWLEMDCGAAVLCTDYTIVARTGYVFQAPKDWTFEGSNDNFVTPVVLDTQAGQTGWGDNEARGFSFANATPYRYYRINVTAVNGATTVTIAELYGALLLPVSYFGVLPPANPSLLIDVGFPLSPSGSGLVPIPVSEVLQGGWQGVTSSWTIIARGGTPPYTFSLDSGSIPTGLTLHSTGVIDGTPTTIGLYTFIIKATDSTGATGTEEFKINIVAPVASLNYTF